MHVETGIFHSLHERLCCFSDKPDRTFQLLRNLFFVERNFLISVIDEHGDNCREKGLVIDGECLPSQALGNKKRLVEP